MSNGLGHSSLNTSIDRYHPFLLNVACEEQYMYDIHDITGHKSCHHVYFEHHWQRLKRYLFRSCLLRQIHMCLRCIVISFDGNLILKSRKAPNWIHTLIKHSHVASFVKWCLVISSARAFCVKAGPNSSISGWLTYRNPAHGPGLVSI